MEREVIALTHSCRELLPMIDISTSLSEASGLNMGKTTMNVSTH